MPSSVVKSFADKTGKSVKDVEKKWDEAKGIVTKDYPDVEKDSDKYFALVTGVLKNMIGIKEEKEFITFKQFLLLKESNIIQGKKYKSVSNQGKYINKNDVFIVVDIKTFATQYQITIRNIDDSNDMVDYIYLDIDEELEWGHKLLKG